VPSRAPVESCRAPSQYERMDILKRRTDLRIHRFLCCASRLSVDISTWISLRQLWVSCVEYIEPESPRVLVPSFGLGRG
jgi:hypothetical protein